MSEQEYRVEITGNIKVYHPIKKQVQAPEYADWFNQEWDALMDEVAQRRMTRGEAVTYPECLYPLRAA